MEKLFNREDTFTFLGLFLIFTGYMYALWCNTVTHSTLSLPMHVNSQQLNDTSISSLPEILQSE